MTSAVATMPKLLTKEIVMADWMARENCLFREETSNGEHGPTHRCHLQDFLNGRIGVRDVPMTTTCEHGEIPEVCPMLAGDFKIRLGE